MIDVVVLKVLHQKARAIRSRLGISIAIPSSTSDVITQLYEEVLQRMRGNQQQQLLFDYQWGGQQELHDAWEAKAEAVSRSVFAQQTIKPEEVQVELDAVRQAIGTGPTVASFISRVFRSLQIPVVERSEQNRIHVELNQEAPRALRGAVGRDEPFKGRFVLPIKSGELYLARTHPVVEGLASWVLDTALDPATRGNRKPLASRCGVSRNAEVSCRTNILLLRLRYHIHSKGRGNTPPMLAEEVMPVAYTGSPEAPVWLPLEEAERLIGLPPSGNVVPDLARVQAQSLIDALPQLEPSIKSLAEDRAQQQADSHSRVRAAARISHNLLVEPVLPVDVLGAYILLPS